MIKNKSAKNHPINNKWQKTRKTKPPILILEEVRKLLLEAKLQNHPWYGHWAFAVLTGMRSGEL